MDQIRTVQETNNDQANDASVENLRSFKDLRLLSDLEMVCVGGGDGGVTWP